MMDMAQRKVSPVEAKLRAILDAQRAAYLTGGVVTAEIRIDRINRAIKLLVDNADDLCAAMNQDFGNRPLLMSKMTDIAHSVMELKHARRNVRKWMKPEKRSLDFPLGLLGARAEIVYQPLGVVGLVSPWNFPVSLIFGPLAGILAAGNRCMIKPSEYTPATSELTARLVAEYFEPNEITLATGDAEMGAAFCALPFDHLLFTGATNVARHVMRAAADNLVPVTLELGGKSPVVIGRSADLALAARRIMAGKMMNAGQVCLAPDYVFVPRDLIDDFVEACKSAVTGMYPALKDNDDYTSIISDRHVDRMTNFLSDAASRSKDVIEINPVQEDFSDHAARKMPLSLVIDPDEDALVMKQEIFGPILPIKPYNDMTEVVDYVNRQPRALALYYFGRDKAEERYVLGRTTSGGVTVNDVIAHITAENLPFGGIGPSGMGAYHGVDGFRNFSHAKSVFRQTRFNIAKMVGQVPPYGARTAKLIAQLIKH